MVHTAHSTPYSYTHRRYSVYGCSGACCICYLQGTDVSSTLRFLLPPLHGLGSLGTQHLKDILCWQHSGPSVHCPARFHKRTMSSRSQWLYIKECCHLAALNANGLGKCWRGRHLPIQWSYNKLSTSSPATICHTRIHRLQCDLMAHKLPHVLLCVLKKLPGLRRDWSGDLVMASGDIGARAHTCARNVVTLSIFRRQQRSSDSIS